MIVRIAITGIALGIAVMILTLSIIRGFKTTIKDKLRNFSGDVQIAKFELGNASGSSVIQRNASLEKQIDSIPNVYSFHEYANKVAIMRINDQIEPVVIKGLGANYNNEFFNSILQKGRVIKNEKTEIMLSKYYADRFLLKVNDPVYIYFADQQIKIRKVKVVGIYESGVDELDKLFIIAPISLLKSVNNWDSTETGGYEIFVKNVEDVNFTSDDINDLLPINLKAEPTANLYPTLYEWVELLDVNGQVIIVLMLLVAGINMISALLIIILERTSMIGLFKALGAVNTSIQKIFLINAAYLVGYGLLIGNAFALIFSYIQQQTHFLKLDQESYYMNYVPIHLVWTDVLLLNAGALLCCVLMVIIPSFLVTRISAIKAVRFN